uniref:Uncharacterized protein n=1 Tax=Cacopsylla melanoneura TaxID=428564 RepID=A0A8D8M243_9HEMI
MRLPNQDPPPEGVSTPHPIRHLKHILRNQITHPSTTKLPKLDTGGASSTENSLLFLSSNNESEPLPGDRGPAMLNICYTTNEVLVIIGVTCFLNFAFILLIMSCVHFFSTRASRLKSAVLVAENGEEYYYEDFQESEESDEEGSEWKLSLDKTFEKDSKIELLTEYINNLPGP